MRFGLEVSAAGACGDARTRADVAHLADDAGWDGVFLEDYMIHYDPLYAWTYDPWVALAAMALRTERIRLGTIVTPIARRRPWKLARELVTLDHLSGGRMILGVGLGDGAEQSFTHFGEVTDPQRRAEMLDAGLDILAGLWSGQPFSYDGTHYTIREVTFLPRPVQVPRMPIGVGGSAQRKGVVRRAARWNGIVPYKGPGTTGWEDFTPCDIAIGGRNRGDDWEQERALIGGVAAAGATWWMEAIFAPDLEATRARPAAHRLARCL